MKRKKASGRRPRGDALGKPSQMDKHPGATAPKAPAKLKPSKLRIIGGDMRGRGVMYHGAEFTRPMRDSVRENLFNILGKSVRGAIAFDLFAGTGVLAFESISRGAVRAYAVEPARRAVQQIRATAEKLSIEDRVTVIANDAFFVAEKLLLPLDENDDTPWIVFLSPPYRMWHDEVDRTRLFAVIEQTRRLAAPGSVIVAETDSKFDPEDLPPGQWDVRTYGSTRLCFLEPANVCGMKL